MSIMGTGDEQRWEYLSDMPKRWWGLASALWRGPDLNMVVLALRKLDPQSAPGHDGFIGAFYEQFSWHLARAMLDIIREVGSCGRLPASWCEGMTRCVPKE